MTALKNPQILWLNKRFSQLFDDPRNPSAFEKTNLTHKITVTEEVPVEVILECPSPLVRKEKR